MACSELATAISLLSACLASPNTLVVALEFTLAAGVGSTAGSADESLLSATSSLISSSSLATSSRVGVGMEILSSNSTLVSIFSSAPGFFFDFRLNHLVFGSFSDCFLASAVSALHSRTGSRSLLNFLELSGVDDCLTITVDFRLLSTGLQGDSSLGGDGGL